MPSDIRIMLNMFVILLGVFAALYIIIFIILAYTSPEMFVQYVDMTHEIANALIEPLR